jgi:hypothetical protein
MKIIKKTVICLSLVGILLISSNSLAINVTKSNAEIENDIDNLILKDKGKASSSNPTIVDYDPDVDLTITVTIKEIRALEKIDLFGNPDFYVKIFINGEEYRSPIWHNTKYVTDDWSLELIDVPDDEEYVDIIIQLWDWNLGADKMCDIADNLYYPLFDRRDLQLNYSLKTGHWRGDDYNYPDILDDLSGYGRANGYDDDSYYQETRDCELWFDISLNDYDNDKIPYWTEVYEYHTDPKVDNTGWDNDSDGVPIEWEWKWGYYKAIWGHHQWEYWFYHPEVWEDHANLDPDIDGLDNVEEYLTSQWGSDPHRRDMFIELDQMEISTDGRGGYVPVESINMLRDAYDRRNIVCYIDDGCMGGGQKDIPFDPETDEDERAEIYYKYFMNEDPNHWRRGIFRYALIIYYVDHIAGFAFGSKVNGVRMTDCFAIITKITDVGPLTKHPILSVLRRKTFNLNEQRAIVYAAVMMHEEGHVLALPSPGHGLGQHLKYLPYRSCMNYFYCYHLVDYSDGRRGMNDYNDWAVVNLPRFQETY